MGLKLFDDSDDDNSDEDVEKLNKIEINQEFARRYEHNKRREDLQRLEELKKKGVIDSESESDESSSSEEEAAENAKLSKQKDLEFFDALIRVRNKDPILKNKEAKLFQSESESENENDGNNRAERKGKVRKDSKKRKPMYLKDVVSKQLIEEGPEFEDEEDEEDDNVDKKKVKSYSEEQEELRKAFLEAVEQAEAEEEEEDDGGEFLREKKKRSAEDDEEDEEDVGMGEKLDEYFGGDAKLDEDMMFLKDYFKNRMWAGDGDDKKGVNDEGVEVSDDDEEIERQEDYEREYNFRFEENAGDRVMGHSRVVEGSVRKKMNARKSQRERKEERMAHAEFERKEELKHLKNVKKKEMMEKLKKIREAAGVGDDGSWLLDEDDLEEEFNPKEHDKKMKEAFDDGYYKAEDMDPDFGSDKGEDGDELEKPDFDKEDELLGLHKGWDDINNSDGFLSVRERVLKLKESKEDHEQAGDEEDDAVPEIGKRKKKRKRQPSEVEKAVRDQLMEEYYKLDYEDTIGDLKTRFKYKAVNPKRYGLTAEEVLMMDEKELNQYVSIKKLAPYREKEWKVPRFKTYQQRQRNKELQGDVSIVPKTHNKKLMSNRVRNNERQGDVSTVVSSFGNEKSQPEKSSGDTDNLSRRSKRRHRQAELKLSHSRLMAYGKIPPKPKSKKKS